MLRVCSKCGEPKELVTENFRQVSGRDKVTLYFKRGCRECERDESREWQGKHAEEAKDRSKRFRDKNPNYISNWKAGNIEHVRNYRSSYENQTNVKLKKRVSRALKHALTKRGSKKITDTLSFLQYSIEELRLHIESRFESWMNWENWGAYKPSTWNEEDPNTWTWQLDHIKPMATHVYSCESDSGFKDAWRLENLRPLRSKENIIFGASMKRINKSNKVVIDGGLNGS